MTRAFEVPGRRILAAPNSVVQTVHSPLAPTA